MTRIGSPLWAAPEILGGRRYCEHVDTYSLGVVMFEVAVRSYPFAKRLREFKSEGGKGMDMKLMREIAIGKRRIQLEGEVDGVSPAFKQRESFVGATIGIEQRLKFRFVPDTVFRRCVAFDPDERPPMQEVARKLGEIMGNG